MKFPSGIMYNENKYLSRLKIANCKSGTSGAYFDRHENHLGRTSKVEPVNFII